MDNKEFGRQFEGRTRAFAIMILKLSALLPSTTEAIVIKNQISKAGTSIGANYREANRSRSKADFLNKIKICESEASETVYWLELIIDLKWLKPEKTQAIIKEATEILAILCSIGKTLKNTK
jgi:four helix bundle protein